MKEEFNENDSFASSEIEEQKNYFVEQISIDREESMQFFKEDFLGLGGLGSKRRTESFTQARDVSTIRLG